jgi:hypothetical protein
MGNLPKGFAMHRLRAAECSHEHSFPITAIDVVLMGKIDPKNACPGDLQPTAAMPGGP